MPNAPTGVCLRRVVANQAKAKVRYRTNDRVRHWNGRIGVLVRRNRPYRQWLVRVDGQLRWWWESEFSKLHM